MFPFLVSQIFIGIPSPGILSGASQGIIEYCPVLLNPDSDLDKLSAREEYAHLADLLIAPANKSNTLTIISSQIWRNHKMNGQKVKKLSHLTHYKQTRFDRQSAQEDNRP